jgi:REP element-mobilizing transposase RayT
MPRNPKCFIHDSVLEICFRAEEGLPLPPNSCIKFILSGILAAAQTKFPVTICHHVIMSNHVHMLIVVQDPEDVDNFVAYVKRESAHAVNRLLGRKKRTVWCEGYDSPTILDPKHVLARIEHLYINPAKANLVTNIDNYPHLSSWEAFLNGRSSETFMRVPRDAIPMIPPGKFDEEQSRLLLAHLKENSHEEYTLVIEPDAWMHCFDGSQEADPQVLAESVIKNVRAKEQELSLERKSPVIGEEALVRQDMRVPYKPKKRNKRSICLSSIRPLRNIFITWASERAVKAREAYQLIKRGKRATYPSGMFRPGGYLLSNLSPPFSPLPLA